MDRVGLLLLCGVIGTSSGDKLEASAVILTDAAWKSGNGNLMGTIHFVQEDGSNNVKVTGSFGGLRPAGLHGFHIHMVGDLEGGCAAAKGHFNPYNKLHGGPTDAERHVGDLGNIRSNVDGTSTIDITDSMIQLHGADSIVGRSVVVHELKDDLGKGTGDKAEESRKTGNAGKRLACGVVGMKAGPFNAAPARASANAFYVFGALLFISFCWTRRR